MLESFGTEITKEISEKGIDAVYDRLRKEGHYQLAKNIMIEFTEEVQKKQAESMAKSRDFYFAILEYACGYCENQEECILRKKAIDTQTKISLMIGLSNLLQCKILINRIYGKS